MSVLASLLFKATMGCTFEGGGNCAWYAAPAPGWHRVRGYRVRGRRVREHPRRALRLPAAHQGRHALGYSQRCRGCASVTLRLTRPLTRPRALRRGRWYVCAVCAGVRARRSWGGGELQGRGCSSCRHGGSIRMRPGVGGWLRARAVFEQREHISKRRRFLGGWLRARAVDQNIMYTLGAH